MQPRLSPNCVQFTPYMERICNFNQTGNILGKLHFLGKIASFRLQEYLYFVNKIYIEADNFDTLNSYLIEGLIACA